MPLVQLRPVTSGDEPLLREVYASSRAEELAHTGLDQQQVEAFIDMQFRAQHTHYHERFPNAKYDVIIVDDQPVGRCYVARSHDEIRILDLTILTAFRGRGYGAALLADLAKEADLKVIPVRVYVDANSSALRLFEHQGYQQIEESDLNVMMERLPGASD